MKKEVIVENKKTHEKEKALLKVADNFIWFLSNNRFFNGCSLNKKYKENFEYSWLLFRPDVSLKKYKTFKEFEKLYCIDFECLFNGKGEDYKFTFANENENNFKEIEI